jgi:hypothetical protein
MADRASPHRSPEWVSLLHGSPVPPLSDHQLAAVLGHQRPSGSLRAYIALQNHTAIGLAANVPNGDLRPSRPPRKANEAIDGQFAQ